jgi:serine-type D-Ala-D-Ala carboxypeptidase (penicillin-binding protein 5/6)
MRKSLSKVIGHLRSKILRLICIVICSFVLTTPLLAKSYQAAGMAVYDINEGRFLFRQNSQTQRAPASTIKVLTALTAERYAKEKLDQWVSISVYAASAQPTKANLKPGEKYKLKDLIALTLVASCNDAARAVGEAVSGSEASFARDMQKMAESLGAKNTRVTNASGLPSPSGMVTTAEDSILFIIAARNSDFVRGILALKSISLSSHEGRRIEEGTHNRLMREGYRYPVMGKTGFTNAARHCFLSYCDFNGQSIAISILGEPTSSVLWDDLRRAYESYMKTRPAYLPAYMQKNKISVAQLQDRLKNAGFSVAGESIYGARTRSAVEAFQKAKRLSVDGIVGPQTWSVLSK